MSKKPFRIFVLVMSLIFVFSSVFYQPFNADNVAIASTTPFTDLSSTHWSLQNIIKMNLRGVVTGYPDKSFGPDKPVTQLEAVLMAVRNMDAGEQVALMDSSQTLPFSVPAWAEKSSKKELLYAVKKGLIITTEDNFKATSFANRAWMAQLMVRMIGKDTEVAQLSTQATSFSDDATIPSWALGYINAALKYKVIAGYPDNSYRPFADVNRAETAALLNRSEAYMHLEDQVVSARITAIVGDTMTLNVNGITQTLQCNKNTWIFTDNGQVGNSTDLKVGDYIKYMGQDLNASYIEILSIIAVQKSLAATVLQVIPADNILVVKDDNGSIITKTVTTSILITDENNQSYKLSELASGAEVELFLDGKDQLISILVRKAQGNYSNTGYIYSINEEQKLIILKNAQGQFASYQYVDEPIVKIDTARFASLKDLQVGDQVKVTVEDKLLTQLELLQVKQELTIKAKIVLISTDKKLLALDVDGTVQSYYLADNSSITIPGLSSALFSDLKVDDIIQAEITEGKIVSLKVTNRTGGNDLEGTIVAVDSTARVLVISTSDKQMKTYEFSDAAEINIDDDSDATLADLKKDMQVSIQLLNDEIIYLESGSGVEGTVVSINEDRHLISLLLSNGQTQSYVMTKDPTVYIEDETHTGLDDISKNDYVEIHLENDLVESIDLQSSVDYKVIRVDEEDDELRVEDEDGDARYLSIKSSVDISIPGISSPDIEDFDEGDRVKATFLGESLQKVEVSPATYGQVTDVDTSDKKITLLAFNGIEKTYTFGSGSKIIDQQSKSSQLSSLQTGDRVEVTDNPGDYLELTLMKKISGKFASRDDDKLFINSTTYSYDVYYLGDDCYVHQGTQTLVLRDLRVNDNLDLYMIDDTVYEIVRK